MDMRATEYSWYDRTTNFGTLLAIIPKIVRILPLDDRNAKYPSVIGMGRSSSKCAQTWYLNQTNAARGGGVNRFS